MVICVLRHLKEKLVWAIDKQLQVISNIILVIPLRNKEQCLKINVALLSDAY